MEAESVAWSDDGADWSAFDRAWISSTWDYHHRRDEFIAWLRRAGGATNLDNPAKLVEWNLDKSYLRDLEAGRVSIVPTVWCEPGAEGEGAEEAAREVDARGWAEVVVKPNVDIGAFRLSRVDAAGVRGAIDELGEACLIQPFLDSIPTEGELSLVHYRGELSHTIRKVPADGDFRVQEQYGGRFTVVEPCPEAIEIGRRVLELTAERHPGGVLPLYGRVDLVRGPGGELCVGEVELIEPALYLHVAPPEATERFAALLAESRE